MSWKDAQLAKIDNYYFVWKDGKWACFAKGCRSQILEIAGLEENPLSGHHEEKTPTVKGYETRTEVVENFRFLRITRRKLMGFKTRASLRPAIAYFFQRVSQWERALLHSAFTSDQHQDVIDVVDVVTPLSGSEMLLIGLFNRDAESFVFEKPEKRDQNYDERIIEISNSRHPKSYGKLFSDEEDQVFWMPSVFGKRRYKIRKLTFRKRFLGIVLLDYEHTTGVYPYVQVDDLLQILRMHLMAIRTQRLENGRRLLRELFESNEIAKMRMNPKWLRDFLSGFRLAWVDKICEMIAEKLSVDACTVFWKHGASKLALAGSTGKKEVRKAFYNVNMTGLTIESFNTERPICLTDVGTRKDKSHTFDEIDGHPKCWLSYPIIEAKGCCVGILRMLNKRSSKQGLTNFAGSDVENARLISTYLAECYEELTQTAEMYRAKEEAQKSRQVTENEREKTLRFMKSLTHEIERPIPSIGFLLENLRISLGSTSFPVDRERIELRIKDAQAGLDLLNVVVSTISQQSNIITASFEETNLEALMNRIYAMLSSVARSKNREFYFYLQSPEKWAMVDPGLTTQLLVILLLNAFKYSYADTTVYLYIKNSKDGIDFGVEDQGEIIPEQDVEKIFQWEYRAENIRKHKYPGAGIGLTLAQRIARAIGSKVYVKQRTPKTVFAFQLPKKVII